MATEWLRGVLACTSQGDSYNPDTIKARKVRASRAGVPPKITATEEQCDSTTSTTEDHSTPESSTRPCGAPTTEVEGATALPAFTPCTKGLLMANEIWRTVVGHPNYEVSDHGRVRIIKTGAIKGTTLNRKYPSVTMYTQGRYRDCIHRMVAAAFIGPRPVGMEVRHLDGDPTNNHVSNLTYGTHAENMADRRLHGTAVNLHTGQTHCKWGHEFTPENTYTQVWAGGVKRQCKTCSVKRKERARGGEKVLA